MSDAELHTVLESLAWSVSIALPMAVFAVHELLGQPTVKHSDHVSNPS